MNQNKIECPIKNNPNSPNSCEGHLVGKGVSECFYLDEIYQNFLDEPCKDCPALLPIFRQFIAQKPTSTL
jgi:hypothetical protein